MEIICDDVSKIYIDPITDLRTLVLRGIDLTLKSGTGEFFGLFGVSGSGKSTLLDILSLQQSPTAGSLEIDGYDSSSFSFKKKSSFYKQIGYLKQIPQENIFPHLTVHQNLKVPLAAKRIARSEMNIHINSMMEKLNLSHRRNHPSIRLSGGEIQRLGLAISLITYPPLVFLDEPFSDQDFLHTQQILRTLKEIKDSFSTTFFISTHKTYLLKQIDHILLLSKGILKKSDDEERRNIVHSPISAKLEDNLLFVNPNVFLNGVNLVYIDIAKGIKIEEYDGSLKKSSHYICYLNPEGCIEIPQSLLPYFKDTQYHVQTEKTPDGFLYFVLQSSGD